MRSHRRTTSAIGLSDAQTASSAASRAVSQGRRAGLTILAMALLSASLAGCGGSDLGAGPGSNPAPSAVITPIGYKATTPAGSSESQITVRSGANVVLSAKDSDGHGIALSGWSWSQSNGPALPQPPDVRALLYLTANTVSFRAPDVTASTTLEFEVKVTNALGASSVAKVQVNVVPAQDPDQFLTQPGTSLSFEVAVLTTDGMGTSSMAPLSGDVPVCVQVQRQVVYMARDGTQKTVSLPQLASLQANVSWAAGSIVQSVDPAGTAAPEPGTSAYEMDVQNAVDSYSNPRVVFSIPEFNDDELLAMFNQPGTAQQSMQLVASDVDSAQLLLTVTATPGSCGATATSATLGTSQLIVAILGPSGTVVADSAPGAADQPVDLAAAGVTTASSPSSLTSDWLLGQEASGQETETEAMAQAYYEAIDPAAKDGSGHYIDPAEDRTEVSQDSKATLTGWLTDNCFDPTSSDYGTSAAGGNGGHATYTNNFDLGFGRDMYFMRCTSAYIAAHPDVTAKAGDVASVVLNYQDLEQAAAKDNPIIAVAMEWSLDQSTGRHVTKFYVYAPDDRTGIYYRVLSANFDGRGQKYVPNSCLACHGGIPPALPAAFAAGTPYPTIQDKTSQDTCTPPAAAGCLSAGDVDSTFLPFDLDSFLYSDTDPAFGTQLTAASGYTRSAQEPNLKALNAFVYQLYTDSTECETPPPGEVAGATDSCGTQNRIDRFAAAKALIEKWYGGAPTDPGNSNSYCDTSTCEYASYPATPSGWSAQDSVYHNVFARYCRTCHTLNSLIGDQFSSSSSAEQAFLAGNTSSYVFQQGLMPDARLTTDRFWASFDPTGSPAGSSLAAALGLTGASAAPGTPQANISATINGNAVPVSATLACSSAPSSLDPQNVVRLRGIGSYFAAAYSWSLAYTPCDPRFSSKAVLVGGSSSSASFSPDVPGLYVATLTAGNGSASNVATAAFLVQNKVPVIQPTPTQNVALGTTATVSLSGTLGEGTCEQHTLKVSAADGMVWPEGLAQQSSFDGLVPASACIVSNGTFTVTLNYVPSVPAMDTISVSLSDLFNNVATSSIAANVTYGLGATGDSYTVSANSADNVMCVLQNDSIPGGNPVQLTAPAPNTSSPLGSISVATDSDGSKCGSHPYQGQPYILYSTPSAFTGNDGFTYEITGLANVSKTANVMVSITGVSYSAQILPIFNASCSGCHEGTTSTASSYWYYTSSSVSSSSAPYNSACVIQDMPLTGSKLSASECSTFKQWIDDGAPTTN